MLRLIFCLNLVWLLAGCDAADHAREKLVITGSSTIAPLIADIARRFESQHAEYQVDVQSGGSSRGIADVRRGVAHIGMVSRGPDSDEQDLQWYALARDGIGMIIHQQNTIAALNAAQIADIFTGRIMDWQTLGGPAQKITVVNKAEGRSTLEVFLKFFALKNSTIKPQVIIGENQQGIKTVAGNIGAIGYVSIGSAEVAIAEGTAIKLLPMNGVAASVDNVRNGSFPIARTLHLITGAKLTAAARIFLDFALSPAVHDLIEAQYFVPLQR